MRLAITGIATALPGGCDITDGNWASPQRPVDEPITDFDYTALYAGRAGFARLGAGAPTAAFRKLKNQCDKSTLLGMQCLTEAYRSSGIGDVVALDRVGVFCATTFGGVNYSEPQLYAQALIGPGRVSAYQAIAWFYAATQGQWTIASDVTGYAKTFTADRSGAIQALIGAGLALEAGHCEAALAAAFDAPVSPFCLALQQRGGRVADERPLFPAEAAAAVCIEPVERAVARQTKIFGIIASAHSRAIATTAADAVRSSLAAVLADLEAADIAPACILIEGGQPVWQSEIRTALRSLGREDTIAVRSPSAFLGSLLAAGAYVDLILGCVADPAGLDFRSEHSRCAERQAILIASGTAIDTVSWLALVSGRKRDASFDWRRF